MSSQQAFLDIFIGDENDKKAFAEAQTQYEAALSLLSKYQSSYGLPSLLGDLTEEQQQILSGLDVLTIVAFCELIPT